MYTKLKTTDYQKTTVFVEARTKYEKSLVRIFAHKNNLQWSMRHHDSFDTTIGYRCMECKLKFTSDDDIWKVDYNWTMPGIYGFYVICVCENIIYSDDYDPESSGFKTHNITNCVVVGKNLYSHYKKPSQFALKKKKYDMTWKDEKLESMFDALPDRKIIIKTTK